MIIGNNSNNQNKGFMNNNLKKNNPYESNKNNQRKDLGFKEDLSTYKYTNPSNDIAMYDKSIAMLHDRLNKGLISLDEFNKKCEKIGKKKASALNKNNNF